MGQGQSSVSKSTYRKCKSDLANSHAQLKIQKKVETDLNKLLKQEKAKNGNLNHKLTQLSSVCLVDKENNKLGRNELEKVGKKIYGLLSNKYRENIKILETQQELMNRQNNLVGLKSITLEEHKDKLKKLNKKIQINDRLLMYDNESYKSQDRLITILKVCSFLCLAILVIYLTIKIFLKYKK